MIAIRDCRFEIGYKDSDIERVISKKLKGAPVKNWKIYKRSLDSRHKSDIHYVLTLYVNLVNPGKEEGLVKKINNKNVMLTKEIDYKFPHTLTAPICDEYRPVIVGAGPAGYFAALYLSEAGFRPIVIERGKPVEDRSIDVEAFWDGGNLNPESNVSFGEGGAGTFSDGKLYTGNKNKGGYFTEVLNAFHRFGAASEIIYDAKPHIGTDVLKSVIRNMREYIISKGGEVRFNTRLDSVERMSDDYRLYVSDKAKDGEIVRYELITKTLILAIGHSARDTMRMLIDKGFCMHQKPYAIGLRVEHKRETIDRAMYGSLAGKLPAADYKLTYHAENGRPVFSFCMCPGGYVVNSSSTPGHLAINGMSYSGRDGENSNTAMIVGITPEDFTGDSPEDAIRYQEKLEKDFYDLEKGLIPVQRLEDFKTGTRTEELGRITPQIKGLYALSEISHILPEEVRDALRESFESFGKTIEGYDDPDTILSGIESRTSSPVRINRDENMMAENFPGILPIGEGAGYAGGITSAAADGIKAAEKAAEYISRKNGLIFN
ncbi:MAG: FAD-dependent monooxygenase [Eubacterium sp.]|nr:FAD-dependent monooxygenase [Eubacterium sp.]